MTPIAKLNQRNNWDISEPSSSNRRNPPKLKSFVLDLKHALRVLEQNDKLDLDKALKFTFVAVPEEGRTLPDSLSLNVENVIVSVTDIKQNVP